MFKRSLGRRGEDRAASFLKTRGYKILARNFRVPCGEIDIVARDKGGLVFLEVKTRSSADFGYPEEAVDSVKLAHMEKAALCYIDRTEDNSPFRFEIVSIMKRSGREEVEIVPL